MKNRIQYALDILTKTRMLDSKFCITIILFFSSCRKITEAIILQETHWKTLISHNKRPYISFVIHQLSQILQEPTIHHQQVAWNALHYIKANRTKGSFFAIDSKIQIKAFSDPDCASCQTQDDPQLNSAFS